MRLPRPGVVGLEQRLLARWRALPAPAGTPLVVAFSGGPDSLALLVALSRLGPDGPRVRALHVDHGWRPRSRGEANEAVDLAAGSGVASTVVRLAGGLTARHPGVGPEEAARRERYLALAGEAAKTNPPSVVVTAHHLDDQAETVLLHLLRGAGLAGAAGMASWTLRSVPWWDGIDASVGAVSRRRPSPTHLRIWRPLLGESRAELARYLAAVSPALVPVWDPSNDDVRYRRNALRQHVLPSLERIQPGAAGALARYAALAGDDDGLLESLASEAQVLASGPAGALSLPRLRDLAPALARRVIRRWLRDRVRPIDVTAERVEAILGRVGSGRGGWRVEVGGGWVVVALDGTLRAVPPSMRS